MNYNRRYYENKNDKLIKTKFQRLANHWFTGNRTEIPYPAEITKSTNPTVNENF